MLLCHVLVQPLWKTEWTSSTTRNPTVEWTFMACQVFAHCLYHFELLSTGSTGQFLLCWCWTMLSLQMMDQGLLCCVATVAGLIPMALFLSTGFLMQFQHYSRCKDLPTPTRVTCFPSMCSHMPLQGPGTLEGLTAEGTVGISSPDIRHLKRYLILTGTGWNPHFLTG